MGMLVLNADICSNVDGRPHTSMHQAISIAMSASASIYDISRFGLPLPLSLPSGGADGVFTPLHIHILIHQPLYTPTSLIARSYNGRERMYAHLVIYDLDVHLEKDEKQKLLACCAPAYVHTHTRPFSPPLLPFLFFPFSLSPSPSPFPGPGPRRKQLQPSGSRSYPMYNPLITTTAAYRRDIG